MFRLSSVALLGQHVLIVESDGDSAGRMAEDVMRSGGTVIATVVGIAPMLAAIEHAARIDSVMIDAQMLAQAPIFVPEWLQEHGIQLVVITSLDEWFLGEDVAELR